MANYTVATDNQPGVNEDDKPQKKFYEPKQKQEEQIVMHPVLEISKLKGKLHNPEEDLRLRALKGKVQSLKTKPVA